MHLMAIQFHLYHINTLDNLDKNFPTNSPFRIGMFHKRKHSLDHQTNLVTTHPQASLVDSTRKAHLGRPFSLLPSLHNICMEDQVASLAFLVPQLLRQPEAAAAATTTIPFSIPNLLKTITITFTKIHLCLMRQCRMRRM